MNPTFSLITPTKNRKETLERAFSSLLKQDFFNWEWIIVDDGSEEFYAEAFAFNEPRVIAIKNQGPFGKGHARNLGLKTASGEWIGFLDDDDELLPNCLSSLMQAIESHNNKEAIFRGELKVRRAGDVYSPAKSAVSASDPWVHFLFHITNIFPWVGPASSLKRLKFTSDPVFQDAQFFLTAALDLPIIRLPVTLGIYNLHDVSVTGHASQIEKPDEFLKDELAAIETLFSQEHPRIRAYKKAGIYTLARAMRYIHHATAFRGYPFTKTWKNALSEHQSFTVILKLLHFSYLRLEAHLPFLLAARKSIQKRDV